MLRRRLPNQAENIHKNKDGRLRAASIFVIILAIVVGVRLFTLMVLQHGLYTALAAGTHEFYEQLVPKRGNIFVQDSRTGEEYPIAMNRDVFTVFADTREIEDEEMAEDIAEKMASVLNYDDKRKLEVFYILQKPNDPYEPIDKSIDEETKNKLEEKDLPGIGFVRNPQRFYPEGKLAANVVGFVGKNEEGQDVGRYGVEGYWQEELAGKGGFLEAARGVAGSWIPLAGRSVEKAQDGADILLTIDRTLQYKACELLRQGFEEYGATSAALVIMDPKTGAIRSMCSLPDFDPNLYNEVDNIDVYNNTAIFTAYEIGSIFKPVTMAGALEEDLVTPSKVFYDSGSVEAGCTKPIQNADGKIYENQTMTGVLENSINTGMVFVAKQLGKNKFRDYVENFGFGVKSGITLDSEVSGTIDSLSKNKGDDVDCYTATASFGQGLTATPLQMASAFSTIANGGKFLKPYIVEEIRYADGHHEHTKTKEIRRVLSERTSSLLGAMLVKVIDSGQAGAASVPGYYVAGKTGTAQIPGPGGYTEETNHSFVGFAPVDDPKFVMIVKFEKPKRAYSVSTAAPVFAGIAKFILEYYAVPPGR